MVQVSWKVSKFIPFFKKDDKSVIENYRPISLLNNFAKIFESLLHDTIYYQIKHHLSDAQHGFVQGRSTVTNLMTISQDLASNLENGYETDVVYTDFSKAFDRLDHGILLRKLLEFGFSEKLYSLFTKVTLLNVNALLNAVAFVHPISLLLQAFLKAPFLGP
ncbi:uncharacterized protein LOC135137345 [Zophobas morio]|uniref:uncharacterized protein LOC135137345 n=1 Tax=Zophobas morio TaxID=2755281 RepID=UPI003082FE0C